MAQFRELAAFSQFSTDLDPETRQTIERGQRLTELLKQPQYSPYSIWEMYVSLFCVTNGSFDKVPVSSIKLAQSALLRNIAQHHDKLIKLLDSGDKPSDEVNKTILEVGATVAKEYLAD